MDYKVIEFNFTLFNQIEDQVRQGYHPAILISNLALACNMKPLKERTNITSNLCSIAIDSKAVKFNLLKLNVSHSEAANRFIISGQPRVRAFASGLYETDKDIYHNC